MLIPLLSDAKEIYIDWNGILKYFDPSDALDVDAFGSYVIDRIVCAVAGRYELRIAFTPVKIKE
jgi:hypothetical protein